MGARVNETEISVEWPERARLLMAQQGLSYDDISVALGVETRSAVGHYLAGRRSLSAAQAVALATRLNCRVGWLLTGELPVQGDRGRENVTGPLSRQNLIDAIQSLPEDAVIAIANLLAVMGSERHPAADSSKRPRRKL